MSNAAAAAATAAVLRLRTVFDAYSIPREFTAGLSLLGRVNRAPVRLLLSRAARAASLIYFMSLLPNGVSPIMCTWLQ